MDDSRQSSLVLFLRLSKPHLLFLGLLQAGLGTVIAKYLGHQIDWNLFGMGMFWIFSVQLGIVYLHQYFDLYVDVDLETRTQYFGGSPVLGTEEGKLPRRTALVAAMGVFSFSAAFTVAIAQFGGLGIFTAFLMLLILLAGLGLTIPPMQLSRSGYGELILALVLGYLLPAFSFGLQTETIHGLVSQVTLPVVLLLLSLFISLTYQTFSVDLKHHRENLLSRIGLQNSIMIHQSSILLAYLTLAGVMFLEMPRAVGLSAAAAIPLGLLQIWLVYRISNGEKPSWKYLTITGVAMVAVFEILMIYSFWIN